ncbi:MAG: prenyltransferase [Chloroflexota bacterium]
MPEPKNQAIRIIKYFLFSASIMAALLGGAMAYGAGAFDPTRFILALLGLFIGQAGGDYLYYWGTHFRGESRDSHTKIFAGWKPLFTGTLLEPKNTLYAGIACLAIDILIAGYFVMQLGSAVIPLALAGGLVAIFFTPLMLAGYKEPVIFVTFGPLAVESVYFAITGDFEISPLIASLPIAFFVTVVAYLKGAHFEVSGSGDDSVVLKLDRTRITWLYLAGFAALAAVILLGHAPAWSALGFVPAPVALKVLTSIRKETNKVSDYLWAVVSSLVFFILSGILICLGFII